MTTVARPGTSASPVESERGHARTRILADALHDLRTRRRARSSLENVFLTVGALCLPTGLVTIILGWYGAAHTGHLYEQNDYMISGGLVGLGLILIGAVLCVGYWMTRQIQATESGSRQVLQALSRLEGRAGRSRNASPDDSPAGVFVVTAHGTMRHRPECGTVAGETVRIVSGSEAAGYFPCGICADPGE